MRPITVAPPAVEPVSPDEARAFQRIDEMESDSVVAATIAAARAAAETYLRRRLITQTLAVKLDGFPAAIELPVAPVQSVTSIVYLDGAGAATTLPAGDYRLLDGSTPPRIVPSADAVWPVPQAVPESVTVTFVAGYGAAATDIPADILAGVRLLFGHLYNNREASGDDSLGPLPFGVEFMLRPHVFWA